GRPAAARRRLVQADRHARLVAGPLPPRSRPLPSPALDRLPPRPPRRLGTDQPVAAVRLAPTRAREQTFAARCPFLFELVTRTPPLPNWPASWRYRPDASPVVADGGMVATTDR